MRMARRFRPLMLKTAGALNRLDRLLESQQTGMNSGASMIAGQIVAGRYQLKEILGEGGMGRVYLARDLLSERTVALKQIRIEKPFVERNPDSSPHQEHEDLSFKREFFTMTKLQHPNTVTVYDAGRLETGERYIAMEFVNGQDLDFLLHRGQMPFGEVYRILSDMAQVLSFIHSRLYVHCDIKAENIRLTQSGSLKLMDFGLMHQLGTPSGSTLKGTVNYMAPEMAEGGIIDGRTDFYSLGVLAFQMITGQLPFTGRSASEVLSAHLEKPVPRLSSFREVPSSLQELVDRLLAKDARNRVQTSGDILRALSQLSGKAIDVPEYAARASYLSTAELVGRNSEQETLKQAFTDLKEARGRSVFITAPAGVGKTRMLQEFRLTVKIADVPFCLGQCRAEGQMPMAAISEALTPLIPLTAPEVLARYQAELAHILPSLAVPSMKGVPPRDLSEEERKANLFSALSSWLQSIARERPFVVCLEDLHWADFGTLEVTNVIIRALRNTKAMFLGTLRSDEVDRLSIAFQTVDEGEALRIELPPLDRVDAELLLSQMLRGFQAPADFAGNLYASTKGNAFFITETLRALIERNLLRLEDGVWCLDEGKAALEFPQTITDVVTQRLNALSKEAYQFCQQIAPIGRMLDLRIIKRLCGLPEEKLFILLDELVERQFLQRLGQDYYFVHDKVRESAYQTLDAANREHTHEAVAQILEKLRRQFPGVTPAVLGYHFARGRSPDKAIANLKLASKQAYVESRALLESARLLEQAAELMEQHFPQREDALVSIWAELVEKGFVASPSLCVKFGEKLLALWEKRFDVKAGFVGFHEKTRKLQGSKGYFKRRRLRRLWEEHPLDPQNLQPEHWVPRLHIYRGMLALTYAYTGQAQRAKELLGQQMADSPHPGAFRAGTQIYSSVPLMRMGLWAQQQREARESLDWFDTHMREVGTMPIRLHWNHAMAYYCLVMGQAFMGQALDPQALENGYELAQHFQFDDILFFLDIARMVRLSVIGNPTSFEPLYRQLADRVRRLGNPRLLETRLVLNVPSFYLFRHDFDRIEAVVERLETLSQNNTDAWLRRNTLAHRALLSVEKRLWDQARNHIDSALKAGSEVPSFAFHVQLQCAKARWLKAMGHSAEALATAETASRYSSADATQNPLDRIIALRTHGQLLDGEQGLALIEASIQEAAQHQLLIQKAISHLAFAEIAVSSAYREQAAEHLKKSECLFAELQCPQRSKAAAELRLRAGGVTTSRIRIVH